MGPIFSLRRMLDARLDCLFILANCGAGALGAVLSLYPSMEHNILTNYDSKGPRAEINLAVSVK